jgi:hypothetical protein
MYGIWRIRYADRLRGMLMVCWQDVRCREIPQMTLTGCDVMGLGPMRKILLFDTQEKEPVE